MKILRVKSPYITIIPPRYMDLTGLNSSMFLKYVPVYLYHDNSSYSSYVKERYNPEFLYLKPKSSDMPGISRYDHLYNSFAKNFKSQRFTFRKNDEEHKIFVMRGAIFDDKMMPLLILTVDKDEKLFLEKANNSHFLNCSALKLYVAKEFITNDTYSNVYRYVEKNIIQFMYENKGVVEIDFSRQIERKLFKFDLHLSFENVEELKNHLGTVPENLLRGELNVYTDKEEDELTREVKDQIFELDSLNLETLF